MKRFLAFLIVLFLLISIGFSAEETENQQTEATTDEYATDEFYQTSDPSTWDYSKVDYNRIPLEKVSSIPEDKLDFTKLTESQKSKVTA
ncbi:MAG TPA: hypothetical protein VKE88_04125, partial [Candidatus Nanoarchaeia archaeon]|nr:hypothetical protein [Candidatus Nanoarchaeia archaeon]